MGICFTWNIEKNSKKSLIVSRETLHIYTFYRIIIQIKGGFFCGIPTKKTIIFYVFTQKLEAFNRHYRRHYNHYNNVVVSTRQRLLLTIGTQYKWVLTIGTRHEWVLIIVSTRIKWVLIDKYLTIKKNRKK